MKSVSKKLVEPAREIPVIEEADVVVVGGGPGGLPAAVAAARQGSKVVLIERYGVLGGLATTGLMGPFYGYAPYGKVPGQILSKVPPKVNKPILGGIPVEIIRRLQKLGGAPDDAHIIWWTINFDPEVVKHVADRMVEEAKVIPLLHSYAAGVIAEDRHIEAVIIESKSGRQAVSGKVFIDATGDGDIAFLNGASCTKGRPEDGLTQAMGSRFRIGGVRERTLEEIEDGRQIVAKGIADGEIHALETGFIADTGASVRVGEITPDATRCKGDGTNVRDLTHAELQIRKDSLKIVNFLREKVPGFESSYLIDTSWVVGVRQTRQVDGKYKLTAEDVSKGKKFPESAIARGCWCYDIHCPLGHVWHGNSADCLCSQQCKVDPPCIMKVKYKDHLVSRSFHTKGQYYDIPYGCLVPKDVDNLLISGRCVSATHEAMASLRVIGTCFAIGEAAGTAAALSLEEKVNPADLNVTDLQKKLRDNDVPL